MPSYSGPVTKFQSDPPGFTIAPVPPPPASLPMTPVTDRQLAVAMAAWGKSMNVTVELDESGRLTNVTFP